MLFQKLQKELQELQKTVVNLTKPSVVALKKKALDFASRPISEFNVFEALEMLESLQDPACTG